MTVAISQAKIIYSGNGVTTRWDIPFPFLDKADLQVYIVDADGRQMPLGGDFSVNLDLNAVIYPHPESDTPPLEQGKKLLILRRTALAQQAAFSAQQDFDPFVLEEGYDKAMMIAQEQAEELSRAVKFPVAAAGQNTDAAAYLQNLRQAAADADAANASAQASVAVAAQAAQTAARASEGAVQAVSGLQEYVQTASSASEQAVSAQNAAQTAQGLAQTAASQAQSAQSAAASSQTAAASSAAEAKNCQNACAASKTAAASSQTASLSSQNAAAASAALAQNWACKTDGAVEGGEYSAKQYALDAANSAAEAQAYAILPAGMIMAGVMPSAPKGFLLCDGQAVSRSAYAALYAAIGTNFGTGDGSSTFNVPDYRGCFLRGLGGASGTLYQKQPMGAPDIYGDIKYGIGVSACASGAISIENSTSDSSMSGGPYKVKGITFRAGASNSVYGAAGEVRPVNFAVNYYIKY